MTDEAELIRIFFSDMVHAQMIKSIEVLIEARTTIPPAMLLSAFTEIMGGHVTGDLGKDRPGVEKNNYRVFLEYLGTEYVALNKEIDLYNIVRSGLIHQYFLKGICAIASHRKMFIYNKEGIGLSNEPPRSLPTVTLIFYLEEYLRDFKRAIARYHRDLTDGNHPDLVMKFVRATDRKYRERQLK